MRLIQPVQQDRVRTTVRYTRSWILILVSVQTVQHVQYLLINLHPAKKRQQNDSKHLKIIFLPFLVITEPFLIGGVVFGIIKILRYFIRIDLPTTMMAELNHGFVSLQSRELLANFVQINVRSNRLA